MNEKTKTFIGVKVVKATPMTRDQYNAYRQWPVLSNENNDEGYLIEYTDGGAPNVVGHAGYISWSPKEQFDNAYREVHPEEADAALADTQSAIHAYAI